MIDRLYDADAFQQSTLKEHTPEDALAMLFMLALPRGTPKPGTPAYEKWRKTRQGRFLYSLYSDIKAGFSQE